MIALEPEAAAVYCRQRKLREFVEGKGDEIVKDTLVPARTQYLVIDNGGKKLIIELKKEKKNIYIYIYLGYSLSLRCSARCVRRINNSISVRSYLYKVTLYVAPVAVSSFHFNHTGEKWTTHWAHQMSARLLEYKIFMCILWSARDTLDEKYL